MMDERIRDTAVFEKRTHRKFKILVKGVVEKFSVSGRKYSNWDEKWKTLEGTLVSDSMDGIAIGGIGRVLKAYKENGKYYFEAQIQDTDRNPDICGRLNYMTKLNAGTQMLIDSASTTENSEEIICSIDKFLGIGLTPGEEGNCTLKIISMI